MHPNLVQQVSWAIYFLGTLVVLIAVIRARAPFPSLIALCSVQLSTSAILFFIQSHYAWYFYTYWASDFLQSAIRLWLLCDVLRSIPGNSFIPRNFRLVVGIAGVLMASGSAWVVHSGHAVRVFSRATWLLDCVLINEQSVTFFCAIVCLLLVGTTYVLGLGWDHRGSGIACGLGLQMGKFALRSLLFAESNHSVRLYAEYFDGLTDLLVLYLWYKALSPPCYKLPYLENRASIR